MLGRRNPVTTMAVCQNTKIDGCCYLMANWQHVSSLNEWKNMLIKIEIKGHEAWKLGLVHFESQVTIYSNNIIIR